MTRSTPEKYDTEIPYFFEVGGSARFAVFHTAHTPYRGAFLFCHPLFEEKLWSHRVYVSLARRMARMGYGVLRMDLEGTGDSEGVFGGSSILDYLDDLRAGWNELTRLLPEEGTRGVFGLRLGGTLALALSGGTPEINATLVWDPILDTSRYAQELLRSNLSAQMATHGRAVTSREELVQRMRQGETIDIEGYDLKPLLYDSFESFSLEGFSGYLPPNELLVQISKVTGQPLRPEYVAWAHRSSGRKVLSAVEEPFWREIKTFYGSAPNLESVSLKWLEGVA